MTSSLKFVRHYDEIEKTIPGQVGQLMHLLNNDYGVKVTEKYKLFLERCLRQKDGDIDGAAKLARGFYTAACNLVNWEASFRPSFYKEFYEKGIIELLKERDGNGRRIFVVRAGKWDTKKENFDTRVAGCWMYFVYASALYPDIQRDGFVTIWDFSGFSIQHFLAVKQWKLLAFLRWAQNGVIGRMKSFHGVNQPKLVGILYSIMKPLIKDKLKQRIVFHSSLAQMAVYIGRQHLPADFGGYLEPSKCVDTQFVDKLVSSDKYFSEMMLNKLPLQ